MGLNIKEYLIKKLSAFQYPQFIFGKELIRALSENGFSGGTVLDCPCGNGEVSYHLSKLKNTQIVGADINEVSVAIARRNFHKPNIEFMQADIFEILSGDQKFAAICVVNSLFLLPDHQELFFKIKNSLNDNKSKVYLIVPNVQGDNFKIFVKENPDVNRITDNIEQLTKKLLIFGFNVDASREIAYSTYYGRKELKYFSIFAPFYLLTLNFFKSLSKNQKGNYLILTCSPLATS
ncbi:MAG: class I SAM-dependent methyltransferase [Bacteroidetes bacterium]|nr:class I SAM-dependent methyltransferase [Bacteroidota bacterium]